MPLTLQYDLFEPNSAQNWLERWSTSHVWESPSRTKKISTAKSHRKAAQIVEPDSGKSRRTIRKVSAASNGDNGDTASLEMDKPKRMPRKITPTEPVQEHPQTELERVKRSLKKVSASAAVASEKSETEPEKPKIVTNPAVPNEDIIYSSDKPAVADVVDDSPVLLEDTSKITAVDEPVETPLVDHPVLETQSSENGEKIDNNLILPEEVSIKDEETGKENHKIRKRRSLPAKQEYAENISQNTPSLPSYMAATESAKAKLRAQAAAKIAEDAAAEYNQARRHSLPASTNGKLTSLSPRIQKPVQANCKGGSKMNKPMTASRDGKSSSNMIILS